MDGGVRRGTDVLKALALGARAVLIGRPVQWGLAAGGEAGIVRMVELIGRRAPIGDDALRRPTPVGGDPRDGGARPRPPAGSSSGSTASAARAPGRARIPRRRSRRGRARSGSSTQPSRILQPSARTCVRSGFSPVPISSSGGSVVGRRVGSGRTAMQLERRGDSQRAAGRVGHDADAVEPRQLRVEQRLADAAADHRVGLEDVEGAALELRADGVPRERDLAAGDRDVEPRRQQLVADVALPLVAAGPRTSGSRAARARGRRGSPRAA